MGSLYFKDFKREDVLSAEIVDADGEADDKEYRQRQQVRQVEIRRFRRHRFGGGTGFRRPQTVIGAV